MRLKFIFILGLFFFLGGNLLRLNAGEPAADKLEKAQKFSVNATSNEVTAEAPEFVPSKNDKISLSLRNIDIIEALKFFALRSGLNIVATRNVSGRVTLSVDGATIKDVFDVMLRSNSLAFDKQGEIYNVMTEDEYLKRYGRNFFDTRQVKVFRLKYAVPEQAFNMLDAMKSDIGRLLIDTDSGAVMIIDTPEKIKEAEAALKSMEEKGSCKVFTLKYALARDVENALRLQFGKIGVIKADKRTNQVVVQSFPEKMKEIEEVIAKLDKKTKAVMVDTKIIKIQLTNALETGVQWEGLFNIAKQYGMSYIGSYPFSAIQSATAAWQSRLSVLNGNMNNAIGSYPFSGTTSDVSAGTKMVPGQNIHVGVIGSKHDFDTVINYLQTLGKTKILSNPSLSIVNNQEAKMHVGERRAYVTTTTTTGTTTKTVSEAVTYVDTGVELSITPTINDDGYVTMKIKPEISSVIGNVNSSSGNVIPIIDTSTAETTVIAKDGATIVLGGLGREETTMDSQQVPFFGNLPGIGFLFRQRTQQTVRTELLIMITPVIFEGDKMVTTKEREAEVYPHKPMKKFDVFQPEALPGAMAPMEGFTPASFKHYGEIENPNPDAGVRRLSLGPLMPAKTETADAGNAQVENREDNNEFKGSRSYN